jgi:hypothetical protein
MPGQEGKVGARGRTGRDGPGLLADDACDTLTVRRELHVAGMPVAFLIRHVYRRVLLDTLVGRRYVPTPIALWMFRYMDV